MNRPGMAKHSESAFNEADAIRLLADLLESEHTIKTFFKENDRTPNLDGFFELVGNDGDPKKQFIVQIKKTKALECATSGKYRGKYVYDLETAFLYYVKAKVAENPAIYFVVDIDNNRVFYIYLSDSLLMQLNFEGHNTIRFGFDKKNIISNLSLFYKELDEIATQRNKKFVYKTEEEIAIMQEAVEYLNSLLDSDFKKIKDHIFPGLWRFGIGMTQSDQFEIRHYSQELKEESIYHPEKTNMFCLYPQYKGKLDPGVSEFRGDGYFRKFDCIGKQTPMEYIKENLGKIIKDFCQDPPYDLLPDIVLVELTYNHALQIHHYFADDEVLKPSECLSETIMLFRYIDHLIFEEPDSEKEKDFKMRILKDMRRISLFDSFAWQTMIPSLRDFKREHGEDPAAKIHAKTVFDLVGEESIKYYVALSSLAKRQISFITSLWKYNPIDFLERRAYLENEIKPICEQWFEKLPDVYHEFYNKVFENNMKYIFSREIEYCIDDNKDGYLTVIANARVYVGKNNSLDITYKKPISKDFSDDDVQRGLIHIQSGELFGASLMNRIPTLYYDGIRCFLYQGICDALKLKCEGININHRRERLFN